MYEQKEEEHEPRPNHVCPYCGKGIKIIDDMEDDSCQVIYKCGTEWNSRTGYIKYCK